MHIYIISRIVSLNHMAKTYINREEHSARDARELCPNLKVIEVPEDRFGKPDSKLTRRASEDLLTQISFFKVRHHLDSVLELYSMDGVYWQLPYTTEIGTQLPDVARLGRATLETRSYSLQTEDLLKPQRFSEDQRQILYGMMVGRKLINFLLKRKWKVSIGVGMNKICAKIACKLNQPQGLTGIVPGSWPRISKLIEFRQITGLGKIQGSNISRMYPYVKTVADLQCLSIAEIACCYNGPSSLALDWAHKIKALSFSIDTSAVIDKNMNKTLSVGKTYPVFIQNPTNFRDAVLLLAEELCDRLEEELIHRDRIPVKCKFEIENNLRKTISTTFKVRDGFQNLTATEAIDYIASTSFAGLAQTHYDFANFKIQKARFTILTFIIDKSRFVKILPIADIIKNLEDKLYKAFGKKVKITASPGGFRLESMKDNFANEIK